MFGVSVLTNLFNTGSFLYMGVIALLVCCAVGYFMFTGSSSSGVVKNELVVPQHQQLQGGGGSGGGGGGMNIPPQMINSVPAEQGHGPDGLYVPLEMGK